MSFCAKSVRIGVTTGRVRICAYAAPMDDIDDLKALSLELFGTSNDIPPIYLRELKRCVDSATTKLGLVVDRRRRVAFWINGCSLGVLGSKGITDADLENQQITGVVRRLDHTRSVNLTVAVNCDNARGKTTDSGRRLTIGPTDSPEVVLDASPGRFPIDKRVQIEHFIDELLTAFAGPVNH
jgi:hypothetical protein